LRGIEGMPNWVWIDRTLDAVTVSSGW